MSSVTGTGTPNPRQRAPRRQRLDHTHRRRCRHRHRRHGWAELFRHDRQQHRRPDDQHPGPRGKRPGHYAVGEHYAQPATGILLDDNAAGTITSGTSKSISSTTANAVNLTDNTGATINFANGGLVINTTSGTGFNATGGGTVIVQGSNNTITSTTAPALNVTNTTIGGAGLTFRSISSNGAASGIVLNNTGARRTDGDGRWYASEQRFGRHHPELDRRGYQPDQYDGCQPVADEHHQQSGRWHRRLDYQRHGADWLNISGNGNDAGTDESGINIAELTGTASSGLHPTAITNSVISNNNEFEIQITNSTGVLTNLLFENNTVSSNGLPIIGNATLAAWQSVQLGARHRRDGADCDRRQLHRELECREPAHDHHWSRNLRIPPLRPVPRSK